MLSGSFSVDSAHSRLELKERNVYRTALVGIGLLLVGLVQGCAPVAGEAGNDLLSAALVATQGDAFESDARERDPQSLEAAADELAAALAAIEAAEREPSEGGAKADGRLAVVNGAPLRAEIFLAGARTSTNRTITLIPGTGLTVPVFAQPVGVRWIDNATNETSYRLRARLVILAVPFTLPPGITLPIATPFTTVGTAAVDASTAQVSVDIPNVAPGYSVMIQVVVQALFADGLVRDSNRAGVLTHLVIPFGAAMPAPSNLAATAVNPTAARLTWSDNFRNEPGSIRYFVERRIGSDFVVIAQLPANFDEFIVTGLNPGSFNTFRVRSGPVGADADSGRYAPSAYTSNASLILPAFALAAPGNLTATAVNSGRIDLAWTDTTSDETGIFVERALDNGGPFVVVGDNLPPNTTAFSSTGLSASTTYFFRVRSRNAVGFSGYSATRSATTPAAPTIPVPPSNVEVLPLDAHRIQLRWRDNSNNETHFVIERSQNGGAFVNLGAFETGVLNRDPFDANIIDVTDEGADVLAGTAHCYRVRARNAAGDSPDSTQGCGTTPVETTTAVNFVNNTAYPLVSLVVNGAERLPGNLVVPVGGSGLVVVPAGSFSFVASNGFIQNGQKIAMYRFPTTGQTTGSVASGQTATRTLTNPGLAAILTRFTGQSRTYRAELLVGNLTTVYTCTFFTNGQYEYRQDGTLLDAGSISQDSFPGNFQIPFRLLSAPPFNFNTAALFDERPDADGRCHITMAGLNFRD